MLDIPISTVHRRIKRLEDDGVIRGYKALIDYEKTGRPISALLLIDLAEVIPGKGHIPKKNIIDTLKKIVEVEEIVEVQERVGEGDLADRPPCPKVEFPFHF